MSHHVPARTRRRALLRRVLASAALLVAALATAPAAHAEQSTLSSARSQTCAVSTDSGVICWGAAAAFYDGPVGPPPGTFTPEPAAVAAAAPATSVDTGDHGYQCVVRTDGSIGCWGWAWYFDQDYWPTRNVAPVALVTTAAPATTITNFVDVAVNDREGCGVQSTGRVRCWQASSSAVSDEIAGITDATAVTSAGEAFCAVRETGGVACWDRGLSRQTGIMNGPVVVWTKGATATNVPGVAGAVSGSGTCALLVNGQVTCWTISHRPKKVEEFIAFSAATPVEGIGKAWRISSRAGRGCAVRIDTKVVCWGSGAPTVVEGLDLITDVSVGDGFACARDTDENVRCWGAGKYLGNASVAGLADSPPATPTGNPRVAGSIGPRPELYPLQPSKPLPVSSSGFGDITTTAIVVRWEAPLVVPESGLKQYEVTLGGQTQTVPATETAVQFTGLTPATDYSAKVIAIDNSGGRSDPLVQQYTTQPDLRLGPPEFEAPVLGPNAITINWRPTGTLSTVNFKLEVDGREVFLPGNTRSYEIAGLAPDTAYAIKLTALDGEGQQQASASATYRTLPASTPVPVLRDVAFTVTGSTTVPALSKSAMPLTGRAVFTENADGALVDTNGARITLNDTQGRSTALGFLPVTATIGFASSGAAAITRSPFALAYKVRVKVKSVKAFGAIPLAGGNNCQTKQITTIPLVAPAGFALGTGGIFAATYPISDLNGCGLFGGLVSPLVASTSNTMSLTLTR